MVLTYLEYKEVTTHNARFEIPSLFSIALFLRDGTHTPRSNSGCTGRPMIFNEEGTSDLPEEVEDVAERC